MIFIRALTFTGITIFMSLFHVGQTFAAEIGVGPSLDLTAPTTKTTPSRVYAGYGHQFKTDIDGGGNFYRDGFRLLFKPHVDFSSTLSFDQFISYDFNNYNFSSGADYQWDDIHFLQYVPVLNWKVDPQWIVHASAYGRINAEGNAKWSDGVAGGGVLGFTYISSPTLQIGLLAAVLTQIEDDTLFVPLPYLNWQFADAWKWTLGIIQLGSYPGFGTEVAWQWTKQVKLIGGFQYQNRRFRLDTQNQVAEETVLPLYGKLSAEIFPKGKLEIFAGVALGGELRLENKNGNKIRDDDYDATPMLGAQFDFVF